MFLGANGEPVEGGIQKSSKDGGWVDGGSNPFLKGNQGEDPLATAAQEMAATSAAYALQKAQLMGAGMAGLVGGGVPSPEAIANFNRNGVEPPSNPYQHLSRDEKIAMITQLQKSKAEREARGEQSPTDMIDPAEELTKSAPGVLPPKKTQKPAAPPPVAPTADRAAPMAKAEHDALCKCGECMAKGGAPPAPMSSTHLKKPEKSKIEQHEEAAALGPKPNLRKSMDFALRAFNVASSEDGLRKSYEIMQKCMGGMGGEYAGTPFEKEALDATIEYKKAVIAIRKEKLDQRDSDQRWKKMDVARDAYYGKLDALEIKKLEHKRKLLDMSKAQDPVFDDLLKKAADPFAEIVEEASARPGPVLNVTGISEANPAPGGSSAEERESTNPDPIQALAKSTEGEGSKGGKVIGHTPSGEPVYASDQQGAVAHHRSMEALHKEKAKEAHDKTPKGQFHAGHFAEQRGHEKAAEEHGHAAFQHESRGTLGIDEKSATKQSNKANKLTAAIHTGAAAGHKNHQEYYEKQTGGPDSHKEHNAKMANHNKLKAEQHEKAAKLKFSSHEAFKKSMGKEKEVMNKSQEMADLLAFAEGKLVKSESGQGGMPEAGGPPSEMPTSRRAVDGGEVAGVGAPTGAQSPPEASVASTSHVASTGEEDNLRALAEVHGTPGVAKADLEDEAGGSKLQKGWVDWSQAADDGEYLRAQLVGQLMNKSLDVSPAISGKREAPAEPAEEKPTVYFQKGGAAIYLDSEDRRIEKAMNRVPGLTFSQGSQVNLGAPVQHEATCGSCGSLTKSFLSSCTECGVSLQGHRYEAQGLRLEKSVADALIPSDEDEIAIG